MKVGEMMIERKIETREISQRKTEMEGHRKKSHRQKRHSKLRQKGHTHRCLLLHPTLRTTERC